VEISLVSGYPDTLLDAIQMVTCYCQGASDRVFHPLFLSLTINIIINIITKFISIIILLRTRRQRQRWRQRPIPATPASIRRQWVEKWTGQPIEQWDEREKQKVLADWTSGWKTEHGELERVVQPGIDPGT
jgi:hypothetical protein